MRIWIFPNVSMAQDAACTCACILLRFAVLFIRCGKNRNSGRYVAIRVMVSTVLLSSFTIGHLRSWPLFTFADGGEPSV